MISLALYFMFSINVKLSLIAMLLFPVLILYSFFFHRRIGATFEKADEQEGKLSAIAQENLTGVRIVRAFGREQYEKDKFVSYNEEYTRMWTNLMKLLSAFWASNDLISGLQVMIVTVMGAVFSVRGHITAGEFIAFVSYNSMLIWPVRMLGRIISEMSKAGISIDRVRYIMNSEEEQDEEGALECPIDRDIVFDNVSYSFEHKDNESDTDRNDGEQIKETDSDKEKSDKEKSDKEKSDKEKSDKEMSVKDNRSVNEVCDNEILKNVSFTIKKGSTLGILGGTGSGKSTLMYLLDRLYDLPKENGTITIGGVDIRKIKRVISRTDDQFRIHCVLFACEVSRRLAQVYGLVGFTIIFDVIVNGATICNRIHIRIVPTIGHAVSECIGNTICCHSGIVYSCNGLTIFITIYLIRHRYSKFAPIRQIDRQCLFCGERLQTP
jgi:ATP-binding cassette subfamily B protein